MRLEGKIGIVTAAGSGMGRAGALRFAKEGAMVGVVDIDAPAVERVVREITDNGGRAKGIVADLTKDSDSRGMIEETADEFGGLDFIWNHVGHPGPAKVEGVDMADFDLAIILNLRTLVVATDSAIPLLRARGGGSLLYTASTSGIRGSLKSPIYSMAKFGVVGFAKALAKRLGGENIRVNVVCPGTTDTPMLRTFTARPDQEGTQGQDVEELIRARGPGITIGRKAQPEEIANAALFLISDEASYITGASLAVDGGTTA
ncbi:MAG: SDR family oxidoreductase [Alphaproteobacteria bacterium]|nr:SDR family oxidoreductase [Alphaproteobacteria bacterium]